MRTKRWLLFRVDRAESGRRAEVRRAWRPCSRRAPVSRPRHDAGALGDARRWLRTGQRTWRWASTSSTAGIVGLVHAPDHAGPAPAREPDDRPLAARVQLAAAHVLGEEGVQLGQQAHGSELVEVVP
jgi:hypothetical protein